MSRILFIHVLIGSLAFAYVLWTNVVALPGRVRQDRGGYGEHVGKQVGRVAVA